MKTAEELNALKNEVEALNKKLTELTEEELAQVSGGDMSTVTGPCGKRRILKDGKCDPSMAMTTAFDSNPCTNCPYKP